MRITSTSYRLPRVKAISGHEQLEHSANMPVIVTAIDIDTGEKGDYVVKLNASERMHPEGRLREIVAAFMAMEMDIEVIEPAVIEISSDFTNTLTGKPYYALAFKSSGINFGSKYIKEHLPLANEIALTPLQEVAAQHIFGFDVLIQNSDRNFEKPNMITNGNDLVILDHELGFGFLLVPLFLKNTEPWKINDADLLWIQKHCLYKRLKGKISELDFFGSNLTRLDNDFWNKASELIPNEWMNDEMFSAIKNHIDLLIEHKEEFITSIKFVLS